MQVVVGRGNRRTVVSLPCAQLIKQGPKASQKDRVQSFCQIAGIPFKG